MNATIITVTWQETYNAEMGNARRVNHGERTFRRRSDADQFVQDLQSDEQMQYSMFAGREPRIENVQIKQR